ncbi:peptidoglycan/xylan/chitin deacetylase (PgdA/CDA1 family) [Lederbergia galactosidilyticus]|nr:peptidoglycan/xylan/chitin deacetylase (PgdA/CDA1 family) [Lederbergia galactosidilytica]
MQNQSNWEKRRIRVFFKICLLLFLVVSLVWVIDYFIKTASPIDKIEDKKIMAETLGETSPSPRKSEEKVKKEAGKQTEKEIEREKEELRDKKNEKMVYLTFDDGPSKWTGDFLDVLKEHGIHATFFMQGSHLKQPSYQSDVKRAIKEGHYVGAHSMTHDSDELYKNRQFVPEMRKTLALIHKITGTNPHLVRPPYGSIPGLQDELIHVQVIEAGLKVWDWTIDSQDWKYPNDPQKIMTIIKSTTTEDVEVVLMHEKEQTLKLLPQIIAFFKEQGYEFGVYSDQHHFPNNFLSDSRL